MYCIRYYPLKNHLKARAIDDQDALPYFLSICLLEMLTNSIPSSNREFDFYSVISIVLNFAVTIFGIIYSNQRNGGRNGHDIILKIVVLGWVLAVRFIITVIPLMLLAYVVAHFIGISRIGNDASDVALFLFLNIIFYLRLGHHISDTKAEIN